MADSEIVIPIRLDDSIAERQMQDFAKSMAADAEELAAGIREGMQEVIAEEQKAGRLTGELADQLRQYAGALSIGAQTSAGAAGAIRATTDATKEQAAAVEQAGLTWREFVKERMGPYMKELGSHGAAIKKIGEEWQAYKASAAGAAEETQRFTGAAATGAQAASQAATAHRAGAAGMFEWKKEAGRTREAAQFLTASLGSIAPASGVAGSAMRLLATAALGGGGLILALEGLHAAASLVADKIQQAKQEHLDSARAVREHAEVLRQIDERTRDFVIHLHEVPAGLAAYRAAIRESEPETRKLQEEINKAADELSIFDDYDKHARKVTALADAIRAVQAASREAGAKRSIEAENKAIEDADKRFYENKAKQNEQNRTFHTETLALERKFAAEEVRIRGDAKKQIEDLRANTGLKDAAEIERRIGAIRADADEQVTRAREDRAVRHRAFLLEQDLAGATDSVRAWTQAAQQIEALDLQIARARRTRNVSEERLLVAEVTALRSATYRRADDSDRQREIQHAQTMLGITTEFADSETKARLEGALKVDELERQLAVSRRSYMQTTNPDAAIAALQEEARLIEQIDALKAAGTERMTRLGSALAATAGKPDDLGRAKQIAGINQQATAEKGLIALLVKEGQLTPELAALATRQAEQNAAVARMRALYPETARAIDSFSQTASSSLAGIAFQTQSLQDVWRNGWQAMESYAASSLQRVIQKWLEAKAAMNNGDILATLGQMLGIGGGGGGGGAGGGGADEFSREAPTEIFGDLQPRASGGPVSAGEAYWVGERGMPEVFTPGTDGTITPIEKLGGTVTTNKVDVHLYFQGDARGARTELQRMRSDVVAIVNDALYRGEIR